MPLQIRLAKALENARAITNIEIQYDDLLRIKGSPDAPPPFTNDFTRTMHVTYIAADGKYRCECRFESPTTTNIVKLIQTAFDGKLWSSFDGGAWLVQRRSDQLDAAEGSYSPLIEPFLFLSKERGLRFVDLRDPGILNGLILPDATDSNGELKLSFPGLPRNGVNQLWSMTIDDTDPDFTPRKISLVTYAGGELHDDVESTCILSDYTNLGAYYFPAKIAYSGVNMPTNHLLPPTLVLTGMVTVMSVKSPAQIPDSTFRLDESKAPRIWDWDEFKGYGVGLILGEDGSNIVVKRIVADSPAGAQNELHVGDIILAIAESNGLAILVHAGKADLPRASVLLRGLKGTLVRLTFMPFGKDDSQTRVVALARGEVRERIGSGPRLTNGMKAPDIEMVTLTNRASEHLSDYAGKIVVLEFWASWCSPCQKSMADLQLDLACYPGWKEKVVLIAASVDDTPDTAASRIRAKGWNQTHNVWLKSKDLLSYHIGGIPYAYVIDAKGTIAASGVVEDQLNIPDIVNQQIAVARMESQQY